MAQECLRAAEALSNQGIQAEVIDPVSLSPLDVETISKSLEKTGRLLVVDTSWVFCGASAEITAALAERSSKPIQVRRMGYTPVNCPPSQPLERHFYPDAGKIAESVCEMLGSENVGSDPSAVSVPRSL
jgi:pyruvate/2-oxoglutarate/acetoin dehydrogenase E1 component